MSKHVFWQALVLTIAVFCIGLFAGFFFENARVNNVQSDLINSEINILDEQVRELVTGTFNVDCDLSIRNTFKFADSIYYEALKLEDYDSANKFPDILDALHRRYDLLRVLLWNEAVEARNRCNSSFHTVVYFYQYNSDDVDLKAKQVYYSRLLEDIKKMHPDEILLIPIATDTNVNSVSLLTERYGINEVPAILIDEEKLLVNIVTKEELDAAIFAS